MAPPRPLFPDETLFESFTFPFFDFNFSRLGKLGTGFPIDHLLAHGALTSLPDAPGSKGRRGLYVHIPFCDTICTFCPFNKSIGNDERIVRYLDALWREADLVTKLPRISSWNFDSVYIGGGTPSVLSPQQASDLISMLRERFTLVAKPEITFEVEAKSATSELLHAVAEAGATRISFGIQTLQPELRKIVNLTASFEQIEQTIEVGTKLFSDVNADMIVGFPGQDTAAAVEDLRRAASLGASSISLYPMDYSTVMSKLLDRMRSGSLPQPAPVAERWEMFHRGRDVLCETYDEQNMYCFGKPDIEPCNYMFSTLYGGYYDSFAGLGCGAYTAFPGMISHNIYHEEQYVEACSNGQLPVERVSLGHAYEKSLVFLPKRLGGDLTEADELGLGGFYRERIQKLLEMGAVEISGPRVSLTQVGKRMYHRIMVGFLSDMSRRIYEGRCHDVMEELGLGPDGSLVATRSKARGMPAAWHLGVDKSSEAPSDRSSERSDA